MFQRILRRLASAVAVVLMSLALAPPAAAAELEGVLTVRWGDPNPSLGKGGGVFFRIDTADGRSLRLTVAPELTSQAIAAAGKRVRIGGEAVVSPAAGPAAFDARSLTVLPFGPSEVEPTATPAVKKVLFILLKFKGDTQTPHSPTFFRRLTNPLVATPSMGIPATINQFYDKTSYGRLRWKGDVVGVGGLSATAWLTLPRTKASYAGCGWNDVCSDLDGIATDGLALVKAQGVNPAAYDNLAFVVNNDLDCCAWGGGYHYGGKYYGATWEPPWGQEAGTYVHEFGHSIGLPHSGWVYYAYDSPWDQMSRGTRASTLNCGSYKSANSNNATSTLRCAEPGSGFLTSYKDALGWIPAANVKTISTVSTSTVFLEATALPLASAFKEVKVCLKGYACTGPTAHYLSVEARTTKAQYEKGLPGDGVVIHDVKMNRSSVTGNSCFFNLQFGWAVTVDTTPGDYDSATCKAKVTNGGLYNAQLGLNKTYANVALGVSIRVTGSNANGYFVKITKSK